MLLLLLFAETQQFMAVCDDVTATKRTHVTGDVMLGVVNVRLLDLLRKKTGALHDVADTLWRSLA